MCIRDRVGGGLHIDQRDAGRRCQRQIAAVLAVGPVSYTHLDVYKRQAQVGGLGMAPGGNIGDGVALFEATHGTAPKYAGKDMVNPGSLILSGAMMLEYMGWQEAADLVESAMAKTIQQKVVTYDLHRQIEGATKVSSSGFAKAIVGNM